MRDISKKVFPLSRRFLLEAVNVVVLVSLFVGVRGAAAQNFSATTIATGLKQPVAGAALPSESGPLRLLIAEKSGVLKIVDSTNGSSTVVAKIGEDVPGETTQLLDVAVHPNFVRNREAFVSFILSLEDTTCYFSVVMLGIPEALQPDVPKVGRQLFRETLPCGSAVGGGLAFGKGDNLFIGVGTGREILGKRTAQLMDSVTGKILRVAVDMESPYGIPAENPYLGASSESDPIWAVGFRDPHRLAFDTASNTLAVIDLGTGFADEVNLVKPKGNFGWPMFEGTECQMMRFDCLGQRFNRPAFTSSGAGGNTLSGGAVIRKAGHPLHGKFLFAAGKKGQLYGIPLSSREGKRVQIPIKINISSIVASPDADIFLLDAAKGSISRLQ